MKNVSLGHSGLNVSPICLGTMTFGEQVARQDSHAILDRALARGVNFIDTAEMYSVPARAETFGATETIIGNWFAKNPGQRQKLVLATKVAGPSRGMPWMREGKGMTAADIVASCEGSLRRLQTDVIDLYQIHWPERHVPAFGTLYYDPSKETSQTPIHEQLDALAKLVKAGKVRTIGLSNETPYGVHEFVRLAEQHGLPRVATVQNPYCLHQPHVGERARRNLPPPRRVAAGLFAAGLWPADGQVRRAAAHWPRCARGRTHGPLRIGAQAALGPPRGAGRGAPLQPARARPRPHAHAAWRWRSATPSGRWPAPSSA
jgi:aryl-alcohol dehydrogenase-like predicted oxidoreductase